ncbi:RNA-guided endonuclease InsQ/TnpB family protein [Shimazuella kribbensis]|uniref:RNA-guided endonuclease InsQ/TnpB family protein n=1 Tax=Shimazuella kribbensis TaxID=139808 RepID=UPI00042538E5|nr:RNA-guided endonuclease TnpB family protein [Shimazuella kribbensis]
MFRTYQFRLYPTKKQQEKIHFTLERCRLLYNRLLQERICAYQGEQKNLTYYEQKKTLPDRKKAIPELKQVYSQVLQQVVEKLDKTYRAFFQRVQNKQKGGFPRYKGENRYRSFTYPQSGYTLEGKCLQLSKIGSIRIRMHRGIKGVIKICTIMQKNGKYYTCFSCQVKPASQPKTGKQVGIDLGVKHLAVTSDEQFFSAPKHLRKSESHIKRLQRSIFKKKKGSKRRKKVVKVLARTHEKIANRRKDYAHKLSCLLVQAYDFIAFEDLSISNMVKNHQIAKNIVDAGWGQLVQYTTYKAESAGKRVVLVDPYQTSQRCSCCGEIVKKTLAERVHRCICGYEQDRDINAAINILHLAQQVAS